MSPSITVDDLMKIPGGVMKGVDLKTGQGFSGVSTDSRTIRRGDIFFAIKGEKFDGHQFVRNAVDQGALLAVVDAESEPGSHPEWPLLLVSDSTRALGDLARIHRGKFPIPILAIGGSNGKTTTKEMVARTLGTTLRVLKTEGNYNNHIGVPLTLFRLREGDQAAVVEIGTNHPGEVATLCRILDPTHGLVTTIGREHLEFMGSVRRVASEEGALYRYLGRKDGAVAFVNADDRYVSSQAKHVRLAVRYGFGKNPARVRGRVTGIDGNGCVQFRYFRKGAKMATTVVLQVPGFHNAVNALAAAAVGTEFGVSQRRIKEALEAFRPFRERMEIVRSAGVTIVNDTYNANPDSVIAALRTLADMKSEGKRIVILADMLELGKESEKQHRMIGREVGRLGFEYLLTFGNQARNIHDAARSRFKVHYDQQSVLAEYLLELLSVGDVVLVKGSRGMAMENVVTFLCDRLTSGIHPQSSGKN